MQKIHWLSNNVSETQSQKQGCLPTCSSSLRKVVSALQKEVQNLKDQNKELEDKLQSQKKVNFHQQNQLMSIIRKMNEGIGRKMTIPNIAEMQEKVMESLELFSNMNLDAVDEQYNQTIQALNRKVFQIQSTFESELCKVKANVVADPLNVKNELVNLYHSAQLIENRNMDLVKQNKKLKLDMQIIKQEKLYMVEDLSKMRLRINFLVGQIKKNEKSTSRQNSQNSKEITKRNSLPQRSIQHYTLDCFPKPKNQTKITFNISKEQKIPKNESQKELTKKYSELSVNDQASMVIPNTLNTDLNSRLRKNDVSFHSTISCTNTPRSLNKISSFQYSPNAILFSKQLKHAKLQNQSIKIKGSSSNYTIDTKAQQRDFIICPSCQQKVMERGNKEDAHFKDRQKLYVNTIGKLEGCLKRQKQKNVSMGNTFRQVCEQNKEINRLLSDIVAKSYHQPKGKIEQLMAGESLVSVLRELKNRIDEKTSIIDQYQNNTQN